jgi:DNA-binding GntR family transcriptional regulator
VASQQADRGRAEFLKERAFQELRSLLLAGEFPEGTILSERRLVARMKMSKTPIRVALERLARDGFVEILPQRGVRVRGLSDKEIADHFDLRIALESWVVDRLARARDPELERLHAILDVQRRAVEAGDFEGYATQDAEFHDCLAVLTGNDEVVRVMRLQRERLFRIIRRIHEDAPDRPRMGVEEHVGIVAALEAEDPELAVERMRDHLHWGRRFLLGEAG